MKSMIEILDVLNWVLEQQLQGKRPNDTDVAKHFSISLEEAVKIHDEIDVSVNK